MLRSRPVLAAVGGLFAFLTHFDKAMSDEFWGPFMTGHPLISTEFKQIRAAHKRARKKLREQSQEWREELAEMRSQVEFLSLTLTAVIAELDREGSLTRETLRDAMISVDQYDGVLDGRLPVMALEELLQPMVLEEILEDEVSDDQ